jgi:GDP-D-mannose dehydratase
LIQEIQPDEIYLAAMSHVAVSLKHLNIQVMLIWEPYFDAVRLLGLRKHVFTKLIPIVAVQKQLRNDIFYPFSYAAAKMYAFQRLTIEKLTECTLVTVFCLTMNHLYVGKRL